ncbi:MAG: CRISPR-associated endonuclease Cas2, partial [Pseudomonadota bacterium]|nr:CRISPR-associated endonuclease Cas2 [Pseudomonadota bacterium]
MEKPTWYLVAYDVRDPRRLQRVHYALKKQALAVQQSVFFVHATLPRLKAILDDLERIIHRREDDLRAYPIEHPSRVWLSGQAPLSGPLLTTAAVGISQKTPPPEVREGGIARLLARLWRS